MNRIKELRVKKHLLQSDIAKYIGKSERVVGFYETGERDPNTETLLKLSELFDVSIDYILGKSDEKKQKTSAPNDSDTFFIDDIKRLNRKNRRILENFIQGLLLKQELEDEEKD